MAFRRELVVAFSALFFLSFSALSAHGCNIQFMEPADAAPVGAAIPVINTAAGCHLKVIFETGELEVTSETDMLVMEVRPPGAEIHLESMASGVFDIVETVVKVPFRAVFEWKPELKDAGFYEGLQMNMYGCDDPAEFSIRVVKCRYCINERDSLHSLAAQFNVHWTQIWSSNPGALLSPDALQAGQEIILGNNYTTVFGDTWMYLSVRFGATIPAMKALNPDFVQYDAIIPGGLSMCVMPETCPERRPAVPGISW
mmetsp:Transcript_38498/g.78937  ORF Transcript_38498/g.78937 Transcript_38498/m.78937 type:complete len:256 (-) Transcript_38498:44-811(-)|eukprot:CAMPEP_0181315314 /NCGR_PEP_ID=MMETSP1101-20121128/15309_1 /TAXON_ID=46948 /ORGANISM="Rhodomonas abbreviata, Strain Caron Lab Isolate" /LENGTH=255 /DNA_ID=CAMNT_0023422513 /DNA_START=203 /DNA_END=970 /DNA_ORIENTATION=+